MSEIHGIKDWRNYEFTGEENPEDVKTILCRPCTCCGLAQPWRHLSLNGSLGRILLLVAMNMKTEEVKYRKDKFDSKSEMLTEMVKNAFTVEFFRTKTKANSYYNNIGKLKWWGFLRQKEDWNRFGIYQFTEQAFAFLHGRARHAKGIIVWEDTGHIAWKTKLTVDFKEAMAKSFSEVSHYLEDWTGKNPFRLGDGEQPELF